MLGVLTSPLPHVFAADPGILTYSLPADIKVYEATDISLSIEDAAGAEVFVPELTTHYTVAISKTFTASITFLANTELELLRNIVVTRETAAKQPTQFSELVAFPGLSVERQGDREVAMIQELRALLARAVLAARQETLPRLPARADLAGAIPYLKADYSGWDLVSAAYVDAIGADLALGAASNINRVGTYVTSVVALADEIASVLLLAPHADVLEDIGSNLDALLAAYAAVTCPELTVV
tara:strand:+ start:2772 stop:3491 length:720 start_codon:yes stop_codon:yes gene_type:complete